MLLLAKIWRPSFTPLVPYLLSNLKNNVVFGLSSRRAFDPALCFNISFHFPSFRKNKSPAAQMVCFFSDGLKMVWKIVKNRHELSRDIFFSIIKKSMKTNWCDIWVDTIPCDPYYFCSNFETEVYTPTFCRTLKIMLLLSSAREERSIPYFVFRNFISCSLFPKTKSPAAQIVWFVFQTVWKLYENIDMS